MKNATFIRTVGLAFAVIAGTCCLEASKEAKNIKHTKRSKESFNMLRSNENCYKAYADQYFSEKNMLNDLPKTYKRFSLALKNNTKTLDLSNLSDELNNENVPFILKLVSVYLPQIKLVLLQNNKLIDDPMPYSKKASTYNYKFTINLAGNKISFK